MSQETLTNLTKIKMFLGDGGKDNKACELEVVEETESDRIEKEIETEPILEYCTIEVLDVTLWSNPIFLGNRPSGCV